MGLFSKPTAKAIAQSKNLEEKVKVREGLRKRYPEMGKDGWSSPKKKEKPVKSKKSLAPNGLTGENAIHYNSLGAGDQAEVDRLLGKGK